MADIEGMIREGYSSLAGRVFDSYTELESRISPEALLRLPQLIALRDNLQRVMSSKDLLSVGEGGADNIHFIIEMSDAAILHSAKPASAENAIQMTINFLSSYLGIPYSQIIRRAKVNSLIPDPSYPRIRDIVQENGETKREFFYFFDPKKRARSLVANIHELYHALQPEVEEVTRILEGKWRTVDFDKFIAIIEADDALQQKRMEFVNDSHELRFFNLPQVLKAAEKAGINVEDLKMYLDEKIPTMDFLISFIEGDAYLSAEGILSSSKILKEDIISWQLYKLLANLEAMLSAFSPPKQRYNGVGVGLCEYLRNHPEQRDFIMNSSDFHQQLSREFFSLQS